MSSLHPDYGPDARRSLLSSPLKRVRHHPLTQRIRTGLSPTAEVACTTSAATALQPAYAYRYALYVAAHSPTSTFEAPGGKPCCERQLRFAKLPGTGHHSGSQRGSPISARNQRTSPIDKRCYPQDGAVGTSGLAPGPYSPAAKGPAVFPLRKQKLGVSLDSPILEHLRRPS